jgi:hypothetical protein
MTRMYVMMGLVAGAIAGSGGCAPSSFIQGSAGRKVIELRQDIEWDRAWQETVDVIATQWDIEQLSKDGRYLRTAWHHGISGGDQRRYRGRITVKFLPADERQVELKTEAQWWDQRGHWRSGYDTLLQRDAFGAVSGRIARTVPR